MGDGRCELEEGAGRVGGVEGLGRVLEVVTKETEMVDWAGRDR